MKEMDDRILSCDSPVKIVVGGIGWFYQTFYDEDGEVVCVRLYDNGGEFAGEYKSLNRLYGGLKQKVKNLRKKELQIARGIVKGELRPRNVKRGITLEEKEQIRKNIVNRMKELMGDKSFEEFSDDLELSEGVVRSYVGGSSVPTVYALKRIAVKTGVTIDWLLSGG